MQLGTHLREEDLERAEQDYPGVVGDFAGVADVSVKAVGATNGPAKKQ